MDRVARPWERQALGEDARERIACVLRVPLLGVSEVAEGELARANDERVALAMLAVDGALPVRWEPALVAVADESSPGPGQALGYCVDAGLGCFMDEAARKLLCERMGSLAGHENYYDDVVAKELLPNRRPTWDWCLHKPNPGRSENVAIFSSGWGDRVYSTSVGFDAHGNVACLVTDFGVLDWGQ